MNIFICAAILIDRAFKSLTETPPPMQGPVFDERESTVVAKDPLSLSGKDVSGSISVHTLRPSVPLVYGDGSFDNATSFSSSNIYCSRALVQTESLTPFSEFLAHFKGLEYSLFSQEYSSRLSKAPAPAATPPSSLATPLVRTR